MLKCKISWSMKQLCYLSVKKILGSVSVEMSQELQFRAWDHFCKTWRLFLYCTDRILYFWMWRFRVDKIYLPTTVKEKYWNILWTRSLVIDHFKVFLFLIICSDIWSYIWLACNESLERYVYHTIFSLLEYQHFL